MSCAAVASAGVFGAGGRLTRMTAEPDTSILTRALYSTDASLYRVVPQAVAFPRTTDELVATIETAYAAGTPVTSRGAGTSCAGNAVGPGLVIDLRRHLHHILEVDPEARTARVQPGVVQSELQQVVMPHGLRYGPDPSTSNRCTIGGMIANNACGPRALGYGRSADNVASLEVLLGTGERLTITSGERATSPTLDALEGLVADNLALIRREFGTFGRQVSGYSLEHLLPEHKFDVAKFLAGTEGTLGVILEATVRLVADAPFKTMIALGYGSMPEAADDAPAILRHRPTAAEGLDRRIVDVVAQSQGPSWVPPVPGGDGWVFVELVDDDETRLRQRADALLADTSHVDGWIVDDPLEAATLWKIRADGAGLAGVSLDKPAYPGWEDAAVPPAKLGAYLRDFDALMERHGLRGLPYGHFGDGCVHCRIDFPLEGPGGPAAYRRFVEEAADLVAGYGGSMSGEHGDGRARSALLRRMYSPEAIALMAQVKALFDPENRLNPGVLVDPRPVEADLRVPAIRHALLRRTHPHFAQEVHRCSGVGKCLADAGGAGQVMCPSYRATGDEKDSTRGRARVLQELVNGELVNGWDSPEVAEALDLCLSCKGCARDCPTGVDMAAYKSIVTDQRYAGKVRPMKHYALGWLPRWGRLISALRVGALVNAGFTVPGLGNALKRGAGVDPRRGLPRFATGSNKHRADPVVTSGRPVAIWLDSFSDCFEFEGIRPLMNVLVAAGYAPRFIDQKACCGLTWISTGQRAGARRQLRAALDVLHPIVTAGVPIIGVEPSCTAVWRSDAGELLPDDSRVREVAAGVKTLAELLTETPEWTPPDLSGTTVVAQPHCHHASVMGWGADATVLRSSGADVVLVGGCCGLAGNFGVEQGHYEVSVAVAENDLLPAIRAAGPEAIVLADGFSCRLQIDQLEARRAITLAELLTGER